MVSLLASAVPVAEKDRIGVDVRRTTLIVNEMDNALALYRDALGLKVVYDQWIVSPLADEPGKERRRRLVLLRANDDFIGVLGLLQYVYPEKPQRQEQFDEPVPGDPIIVINVEDFDKVWAKVEESEGVKVMLKPETIIYPRKGGGEIAVIQTMIRDPNDYWIEINKILSEPASEQDGE
jgi:catechol 2,3-dioxygenase-like lactoylglutathione lyase family enzyme